MSEKFERNSIQIYLFSETRVGFYTKTYQADFFQIHGGKRSLENKTFPC